MSNLTYKKMGMNRTIEVSVLDTQHNPVCSDHTTIHCNNPECAPTQEILIRASKNIQDTKSDNYNASQILVG